MPVEPDDDLALRALAYAYARAMDRRDVDLLLTAFTPDARLALTDRPRTTVQWCDLAPGAPPGDSLVAAVRDTDLTPATRVWAAGEAAAVQRIRRHLFENLGLPRGQASVRGYWKHGRSGDSDPGA